MVAENARRLLTFMGIDPTLELAKLSPEDLGTELAKSTTAVFQNPSQGTVNDWVSDMRVAKDLNPGAYGKAMTEMKMAASVLPGFADQVKPFMENGVAHNMDGGAAQTFNNIWPSGVSALGFGASGIDTAPSLEAVRSGNLGIFKESLSSINTIGNAGGSQGIGSPNSPTGFGGVSASLAQLHLDDGNWPFTSYYGLCYVKFAEMDADEGKEASK
jgi:hypothetical protein